MSESEGTWIDRSDPTHPREIHPDHLAADADHVPEPYSGFGDEISDNCARCGLATTVDGKRHGFTV